MLNDDVEAEMRQGFARSAARLETPRDARERLLRHDYRPRGPRRRLAVTSVVGLAAVAAVLALVVRSPPGPSRPNGGTAGRAGTQLSLRLVDEQIRLTDSAPVSVTADVVGISCATANECETVGNAHGGRGAVAAGTEDGGRTWTEQTLPPGLTQLSSLSCTAGAQCVAVGRSTTGAAIVATTDGGAIWIGRQVPPGVTTLASVSCTTAGRCWAVGDAGDVAAVVRGSTSGIWEREPAPAGVTTLTTVGCNAGTGTPTCVAVGTAGSAPAAVDTVEGAAWATMAAPSGATALASAGCTNAAAPSCTTLAKVGNVWEEASIFPGAQGPGAQWGLLAVPNGGTGFAPGTVLAGNSTCMALGGPSCTPADGPEADTITSLIAGLDGQGANSGPAISGGPGPQALVSGYFASQPSPASGPISAVWYVGLAEQGLTAEVVLTPAQRIDPEDVAG